MVKIHINFSKKLTSNIAESYVSGLVQSYRDAFVKKQVTFPQIVVSLRVSTNWTQNEIDQFYSVIHFAFDVSSNYISVFFAESEAGFNDFSKMDWKFQSRHDSCWRGDGLRHITEYYFKAREYIIGQLDIQTNKSKSFSSLGMTLLNWKSAAVLRV